MITVKNLSSLNLCLKRIRLNPVITQLRNKSLKATREQWQDSEQPQLNRIDETKKIDECLFPLFNELGVTTNNGVHTLSAHCTSILKLIRLGAINKNVASQYSHYLNHLCRSSTDDADSYAKISLKVVSDLIHPDKELPNGQKAALISDCSTSSRDNCIEMCKMMHDRSDIVGVMSDESFNKMLFSCYKFSLWKQAHNISELRKRNHRIFVNQRVFDKFVEYVSEAAQVFKGLPSDKAQIDLRQSILEHLYQIIESSFENRVMFATSHPQKYKDALRALNVDVSEKTTVKNSGRCLNCKSKIPLFDAASVEKVNQEIKSMLVRKIDSKSLVHTNLNEMNEFERFLNNIIEIDGKPIDCVIDGLNLAYSNAARSTARESHRGDVVTTRMVATGEDKIRVLLNTIIKNDMLKTFKKILIVGRKHQQRWPKFQEYMSRFKINFYGTQNNSTDDLFQLYAATLGPDTMLVSNDSFRTHTQFMEHSTRVSLLRWLDTHQVAINRKTLMAIWPTKYQKLPTVDREKGRFHLPILDFERYQNYTVNNPIVPVMQEHMFLEWLCCDANANVDYINKVE